MNRDEDAARTLNVPQSVIGGKYNNTVENCINACGAANYSFAGMKSALDCCTSRLFEEFHLQALTRLLS